MGSADVSVKCRVCGKMARAGSFTLSAVHGMMVCPDCMKNAGKKKEPEKKEPLNMQQPASETRPAGWDRDDEEIEKLYAQKQRMNPKRPHLEEGMKLKCRNCGYVFVYRKIHNDCPYCGSGF